MNGDNNSKVKYKITNIFSETEKSKQKERINQIIRLLCVNELENIANMEYNEDNTLFDDTLLHTERSVEQC